jgi:NAD(P)H-flavin reductase
MHDTLWPKIGKPAPFTSYRRDGRYISFFGDNHPVYTGTVVKAMASAKDGYPGIVKLHEAEIRAAENATQQSHDETRRTLFAQLDDLLLAELIEVKRLAPAIIELVARAPMAARRFEPGHLYRVQTLETAAPAAGDAVLTADGLALPGLWADRKEGRISLIALEFGASSRLCADWKPGQRLVVMGPTGAATEIRPAGTVLLAGDGVGNGVSLAIARALRAAGNRIVLFASYGTPEDIFNGAGIEASADVIVWAVEALPVAGPTAISSAGARTFVGGIVDAMEAYAKGELGSVTIPLDQVDHIIAIGSDRMMASVKGARHGRLAPYLKPNHKATGSINSPMQCMMKGVCAQCLCRHVDPDSGREFFVYSCSDQNQNLDSVDFDNLHARLRQNSVQQKLSNRWLDRLRDQ